MQEHSWGKDSFLIGGTGMTRGPHAAESNWAGILHHTQKSSQGARSGGCMSTIPEFGRQEDRCKFEASLGYILNSTPAT